MSLEKTRTARPIYSAYSTSSYLLILNTCSLLQSGVSTLQKNDTRRICRDKHQGKKKCGAACELNLKEKNKPNSLSTIRTDPVRFVVLQVWNNRGMFFLFSVKKNYDESNIIIILWYRCRVLFCCLLQFFIQVKESFSHDNLNPHCLQVRPVKIDFEVGRISIRSFYMDLSRSTLLCGDSVRSSGRTSTLDSSGDFLSEHSTSF